MQKANPWWKWRRSRAKDANVRATIACVEWAQLYRKQTVLASALDSAIEPRGLIVAKETLFSFEKEVTTKLSYEAYDQCFLGIIIQFCYEIFGELKYHKCARS